MTIDTDMLENICRTTSRLWVFGYGSILWKTGFKYNCEKIGYIKGYVRRFWQGNTTHRGTPEKPGRVATLVEDNKGRTWGAAYELVGEEMIENALQHLGMRECKLGGYGARMVTFYDRTSALSTCQVLVFMATPTNQYYLGPSPVEDMANEIACCKGPSGDNMEYVTRLADFVRTCIPEDLDEHLFQLDKCLRNMIHRHRNSRNNLYETDDMTYITDVTAIRKDLDGCHDDTSRQQTDMFTLQHFHNHNVPLSIRQD